jgi:hypothetical protein
MPALFVALFSGRAANGLISKSEAPGKSNAEDAEFAEGAEKNVIILSRT